MSYLEAIRAQWEQGLGALLVSVTMVGCAHAPVTPVGSALAIVPKVDTQALQVIDVVEVAPSPEPERFSLAVRDADLAEVLMVLAKDASFSLTLSPDVHGRVTADLKEVTLAEALDALLEPLGLDYRIDGERVHVSPPGVTTRAFHLDYLNAKRGGNTALTISAGAGDGRGVGGHASSSISRSVDVDLWEEVVNGLQMVIAAGDGETAAQVVINRQAGTILVTADSAVMRRVADYLDEVQGAIARQVMIEAKIVEVQLADGYEMGVDWAAIPSVVGGLTGSLSGGIADSLALQPTLKQALGGTNNAFRFGATSHDLAFLLDAIATQGQVRVLSSPRIAALNNQPAVIKVAQEQTFFSRDRQTNVAAGVQQDSFTVDKEKFTIGIVLDILPRIAADGTVVMNVHPSITEFVEEKVFPPGAIGDAVLANAPVLDVRELDTVVRLSDGETLVIAGLMRQEEREQLSSVPVLGGIPFLGALFRNTHQQRRNSELVIFLTPHVVDEASDIAMASPLSERAPTYHLGGKATRFGVSAETDFRGWR
jgi:MSHA biogenesis protein MshL